MTTTYLDLVTEKATGRVTEQVRREIGGLVSEGGLISEPAQLRTYECDGLTGFRVVPALVVLPASTEEVAAVVRVCARERIPFVARGAGTGLSGGALPVADGIVIGLARMREILSVDAQNQRAVVQPGVTNLGISAAVAPHGLYFAPDPSSQVVCTIGGNVAENSGGAHCLKYGFTTNHVLGLTMVCADGSVVTLGGDSLDQVGPDLRAVVVGSEGTVGIVTEVTVRLLRKPEEIRTLVADFPDAGQAGNAVSDIVSAGIIPAAVEMLDSLAIEACEKATGAGYSVDTPAALVVELDGVAVEVDAEFERVQRICRDNQSTHIRIAEDPSRTRADLEGPQGRLRRDGSDQPGLLRPGRGHPADQARRHAHPHRGDVAGGGTAGSQRVPCRRRQPAPAGALRQHGAKARPRRPSTWRPRSSSCAWSRAVRSPVSTASAATRPARCRRCSPSRT